MIFTIFIFLFLFLQLYIRILRDLFKDFTCYFVVKMYVDRECDNLG